MPPSRITGDPELGSRLKALREEKSLSLRELSRRAGVAASFLSSMEKGRHSISVAILKSILDVLGLTLGEFFGRSAAPTSKVVYHPSDLVEISGQRRGLSFKEVGAGRPERLLQLLIKRYDPGADTGAEPYRHGMQEAGVVLRGTLELQLDGEVHVLHAGDCFFFDSRRPHRFRNRGKVPVDAVSVNTPPSL
ncbi:MAG TPA: cupin domain-containing protein [Planctomycetota bacterium]|nr:cupin domain-containing protein [Planctomycetota bacterium]